MLIQIFNKKISVKKHFMLMQCLLQSIKSLHLCIGGLERQIKWHLIKISVLVITHWLLLA